MIDTHTYTYGKHGKIMIYTCVRTVGLYVNKSLI